MVRSDAFWALVSIATATACLVVAHGVARRRSRARPVHLGGAELARGALAGAVFVVGAVVVLDTIDPGIFGAVRVVYLAVTVSVPLVAGVLLIGAVVPSPLGKPSTTVTALAVIGLLPAAVGVWATHVEPFRLETDRAHLAVPTARAGDDPVRIGVITDIQIDHVGAYELEAVDRMMAEDPDLVLLPGDILQCAPGDRAVEEPRVRELLRRLHAPGGVFAVDGDSDQPPAGYASLLAGTGVRYLRDEQVKVEIGDRTVTLAGTELDYESVAARTTAQALEAGPGDDDVRILLAHRPDIVRALAPDSRVDLVVTGHTHGGQVAVPFVGPLMTMTGVPRSIAAGGLHDMDGRAIYVGRGVGMERGTAPQVRFLVPPNIGVLTLDG